MVIYWDVLLAVNLVLNGLILYLTALGTGVRASSRRILLAALLGAGYTLASLSVDVLTSPLSQMLLAVLLVSVCLGYHSWQTLLFRCSVFYLVSFALGGAILGWLGWWQEKVTLQYPLSFGEIGGGVLIGAAALFLCLRTITTQSDHHKQIARISVVCAGRRDTFDGLIDTGSTLATMIRRTPVIVAEYTAMATITCEIHSYLQRTSEDAWLRGELWQDELWHSRSTIIPYRTVNGCGVLLGIRTDQVTIDLDGRTYQAQDIVIAITKRTLSDTQTYRAIVPYRLLTEGECEKGEVTWGT